MPHLVHPFGVQTTELGGDVQVSQERGFGESGRLFVPDIGVDQRGIKNRLRFLAFALRLNHPVNALLDTWVCAAFGEPRQLGWINQAADYLGVITFRGCHRQAKKKGKDT